MASREQRKLQKADIGEIIGIMDRRQIMGKELAEVIEENEIVYHLEEDGCYYPDVRLPHYNIGKYGLMRWVSVDKLQK